MKNPLLDKDFLYQLDQKHGKEIFAKIISLNIAGNPTETIEGRVTGGSINIDGTSTVRRSCDITLIAENFQVTDYYWGLKTKIKVEIGLRNEINSDYPDIIWFPQGIFILTKFNTTVNTNSCSISISGRDKMCMLNGELGGALPASINFDNIDEYDDVYDPISFSNPEDYEARTYYTYSYDETKHVMDFLLAEGEYVEGEQYYQKVTNYSTTKLPIRRIIRESVHTYAGEPYYNIIINDLEDYGLELMEYRGDKTLYLLHNVQQDIYTNMTDKGSQVCEEVEITGADENGKLTYNATGTTLTFDSIPVYDPGVNIDTFDNLATTVIIPGAQNDTVYTIMKTDFGDTVGYKLTDLIYPGELTSSLGEALTSILDKIKNMLGDFEYFYNLDGQFIWQRRHDYVATTWNTLVDTDGDKYADLDTAHPKTVYQFDNTNLVTSIQNTYDLANIKNDFAVWGTRTTSTGIEMPIHARYAIDKKPTYYKAYPKYDKNGVMIEDSIIYVTSEDELPITKEHIMRYYESKIYNNARNFELKHPARFGLPQPKWDETTQSFSPGWWDVRDFQEYYMLLSGGRNPNLTMKWYAKNDESGCVPIESLIPLLAPYSNSNLDSIRKTDVWVFTASPRNDSYYFNFGHNGGRYSSGRTIQCTCYEDTDSGVQLCDPIKKVEFHYPYAGCADQHTTGYFLNEAGKDGYTYFYNPQFPFAADLSELITQTADMFYQDYIETHQYRVVDWRELIYQMADDYYKHGQEDDFLSTVMANNAVVTYHTEDGSPEYYQYYPGGKTGYEQYYVDMISFWRELYNINPKITYQFDNGHYEETQVEIPVEEQTTGKNKYLVTKTWVDSQRIPNSGTCDYYLPYSEEEYNQRAIIDQEDADTYKANSTNLFNNDPLYSYWNKAVVEAPETLNFWFDFLDDEGYFDACTIPVLGDRAKIINDKDVTSIYFRETANLIFASREQDVTEDRKTGYIYITLPSYMENLFTISYQGKSAKDEIDNLVYQYACCPLAVNLSTLPVYSLDVNSRISIYDKDTNLDGDYIVSRYTIPLSYNGTMSITATRVIDRII